MVRQNTTVEFLIRTGIAFGARDVILTGLKKLITRVILQER